jgi:hypothetical protein
VEQCWLLLLALASGGEEGEEVEKREKKLMRVLGL